jgi:hypothetical protein
MKTQVKPIKKASNDPVREAKGHPSGPSLTEMLYREEEKVLEKRERRKKPWSGEPDDGDIRAI